MAEPIIAAVRGGARPDGLDPRCAAIHDFSFELLRTSGRVADETYEAARRALGEPAVVELTAIVGYYTLVAYTLNVFRIPAS
jgi:4-carboxymuconolactone decarboxylase